MAQAELGWRYYYGRGVKQADDVAVAWFRKSAAQNCAKGQSLLCLAYTEGRGVPQDQTEALKWGRKAAEQYDLWAISYLAHCYANGKGVPADLVETFAWLDLAYKSDEARAQVGGDSLAAELDYVRRMLSPNQLASGLKRADELRAQIEEKRKSSGK